MNTKAFMSVKQLEAHEQNLDAAYREIEAREAMGEDMSNAYVDHTTYAVIKQV